MEKRGFVLTAVLILVFAAFASYNSVEKSGMGIFHNPEATFLEECSCQPYEQETCLVNCPKEVSDPENPNKCKKSHVKVFSCIEKNGGKATKNCASGTLALFTTKNNKKELTKIPEASTYTGKLEVVDSYYNDYSCLSKEISKITGSFGDDYEMGGWPADLGDWYGASDWWHLTFVYIAPIPLVITDWLTVSETEAKEKCYECVENDQHDIIYCPPGSKVEKEAEWIWDDTCHECIKKNKEKFKEEEKKDFPKFVDYTQKVWDCETGKLTFDFSSKTIYNVWGDETFRIEKESKPKGATTKTQGLL